MSGRCILLKFVPLLGLYIFVKTFFFKGTYWKNRFGPDPFVSDLIESWGESTDEVLHNKINEYYNEIKKWDDIWVWNSDNGLDKKGYQNNNQKSLINILIIVLLIINLIINIFNVISNNAKSAISNIEAMKVWWEENYKKLQKIMNNSMYKANYSKNLDEMASEIKKGNYIDVPY